MLKLNNKRTFYIGFAFFTILMLWQVYNYYCPMFLEELLKSTFGAGDYNYLIGIIMAMDNILALFMLPLFGTLSDKTNTKLGKRMPYIIIGTVISLIAFPFISILYIKNSLVGVAILMALILIAMNIYRSPSVALMPDVTPKPLRAKANAIINFVGYIGAIIGALLTMVFTKKQADGITLVREVTIWPFVIVSFLMAVALIILVLKIKENKIVEEMKDEMAEGEKLSETMEAITEDKPLGKADKINLWLLIGSVFLWYFAFNAVETFGSLYAKNVLQTNSWGLATSVLAVASLVAFLPTGYLSEKIGRKNSIILGLGLMIVSLFAALFVTKFGFALIALFAVAGVGWAIINVNSYPMFVELSNNKNLGKFTGYYYSASQIAQSITPIIIGFVMDFLGYKAFFPYAAIFMALALVVFSFVKVNKKQVVKTEEVATEEQSEEVKEEK
ncbi:MAG: MFS transporter [Clostridia bacterium]|nr:MFS transporter [Clostridia bacterium]